MLALIPLPSIPMYTLLYVSIHIARYSATRVRVAAEGADCPPEGWNHGRRHEHPPLPGPRARGPCQAAGGSQGTGGSVLCVCTVYSGLFITNTQGGLTHCDDLTRPSAMLVTVC